MLRILALFDHKKHQASHQVGTDEKPTNRMNAQKVVDHTVPPAKQPEVARYDSHNSHQTADHKP